MGRLIQRSVAQVAPDSYENFITRENAQAIFGYLIPTASGDFQTVRAKAEAAVARLDARKSSNASEEFNRNVALANTLRTLAEADYNLKDYEAAERAIKRALDLKEVLPQRTVQEQRDASDISILAAIVAARQERYEDAQRTIAPALALHRKLLAENDGDFSQRVQYARAVYAYALSVPKERVAVLREAASTVDTLPLPMQRLISVSRLRGWITEAQAATR
jgi:tetratricopeptide (TPR) repeat protein